MATTLSIPKLRKIIDNIEDEKYRNAFRYQFLIGGTISEVCGDHRPEGKDAFIDNFEINSQTFPAVFFKIKSARRKRWLRICALPLEEKYEPWSRPVFDWFQKHRNENPFVFSSSNKSRANIVPFGKKRKELFGGYIQKSTKDYIRNARLKDLKNNYRFDYEGLARFGAWRESKHDTKEITNKLKEIFSENLEEYDENKILQFVKKGAKTYFKKFIEHSRFKSPLDIRTIEETARRRVEKRKRPILYSYFERTANLLLAKYEQSKEQTSPVNIGKNREKYLTDFLKSYLPPSLKIENGEIFDSKDNRTGQLDTIIRRNDCPNFRVGEPVNVPVEGVFGVVEIKSNLSREKLKESLNTLKKVKELKIYRKKGNVKITSEYTLDRPLRCIFSYEGAEFETLLDELSKPENHDIVDFICVLSKYAIVRKEFILDWDKEDLYTEIPGKAASLGLFCHHLLYYATQYIERSIDLSIYFMPYPKWFER